MSFYLSVLVSTIASIRWGQGPLHVRVILTAGGSPRLFRGGRKIAAIRAQHRDSLDGREGEITMVCKREKNIEVKEEALLIMICTSIPPTRFDNMALAQLLHLLQQKWILVS